MAHWTWSTYDDIGKVIELNAVYDDTLKKNEIFTDYAVLLANRICEDLSLDCIATYGKWGARLEPTKNPDATNAVLEYFAQKIISHRGWQSLEESTYVFTYGNQNEE